MRISVSRQGVIALLVTVLVLAVAGYATVWTPWSDLRAANQQIEQIENPEPAPPSDSPEQQQAIPETLERERAVSAIRAAASDMGRVRVAAQAPRQLGQGAPMVHPFTVTLQADPAQLADFVARLQQPLHFEGTRIVGTKGALLLSVAELGPAPGGQGLTQVVVHGYSRR